MPIFYKAADQRQQSQLKRLLSVPVSGLLALILTGCSVSNENSPPDVESTDANTAAQNRRVQWSQSQGFQAHSGQSAMAGFTALAAVTSHLLDDLVQFNQGLRSTQLVVVATPVFLNELNQTHPLGLALQDSLMTGLQQRQFTVIDANMSAKLRITAEGDFMLTRDWQQLSSSLMVDHALVSTMSVTSEGLILNARLLNLDNKRLISSAQAFFRYDELAGFMTPPENALSQSVLQQRDDPSLNISMNEAKNKHEALEQEGLSGRTIEYF
ncbi:FlgO family outer membrane protein [Shewanella surugensis]|uniref:FlgO domain-containing protein n=1 Tax=Shewanella surugensis TaxID=212020 RepID=A0ABT0LIU1_9GAMM|nr:FlgO family outer membrane protein [Shewanella surugensis]MCL1127621.1 hypothetical protein [Shewanella surugensis]